MARFVTFSLLSCPPNVLWQTWLERTFPGYTAPDAQGTAQNIAQQPVVQAVSEKAAPVIQPISDKTSAATTSIANNEAIQGLSRRATDGIDKVRSAAMDINARTSTLAQNATEKLGSPGRAKTFSARDAQAIGKSFDNGSTGEQDKKEVGQKKKLNIKNTAIKFSLDQSFGAVVNTILFIAGMGALKGDPLEKIVSSVQHDTLPLIFAGQKLWPAVSIISFTLVPLEHRTVFGGIIGVGWGIFLSLLASGKK